MKVPLTKPTRQGWRNPRSMEIHVVASLPFVAREYGGYIHRPRRVTIHGWDGVPSHVSIKFWCGSGGYGDNVGMGPVCGVSKKPRGNPVVFMTEPPPHRPVCATCEGRAIGAGQLGSPEIAGRRVLFAPRAGVLMEAHP